MTQNVTKSPVGATLIYLGTLAYTNGVISAQREREISHVLEVGYSLFLSLSADVTVLGLDKR